MEKEKISIEESKNKGSRTSIDEFKARNEEINKEAVGKSEALEKGRAEFREQQKTPGVKQETLDVNVNVDGTNHQISKTEIQTVDTPKESTKEIDSKTQDHSNPHLSEPEKEGMEHSFDMGIGEDGGVFDKLTEQIGASIVEKATGNKDNQPDKAPDKSDKELWNEIEDQYSPSGVEDGKDKEMEIER